MTLRVDSEAWHAIHPSPYDHECSECAGYLEPPVTHVDPWRVAGLALYAASALFVIGCLVALVRLVLR